MPAFEHADLRFEVEHRNPAPGGGPTLRVRDGEGKERLRFDCFERGAHWHLDPAGRDEISRPPEGLDALEWLVAELRGDAAGWLVRAGLEAPAPGKELLDAIEAALRNPPLDLDAVRPESRRPSVGEKWATYPDDVLPLWVADMDFPLAEPIRRVLARLVERGDVGYPIHPAPTDVPALAVERMERLYGWKLDPSRVEILSDVVQGMTIALQQLSEPGEGAVVQTPIYPPFLGVVRELGRRLVETPLALGASGYEIDLDALRAAVDEGTRVLLFCNPHNPSGRVFRRDELEGVAQLAIERDLFVVSDEIHQDLVWSGHTHVPLATLSPEIEARTLTLTAASKAFNVAGLRCAVALFGSDALKERFRGLPRGFRGGISVPGIEALQAAWRHGGPWLDGVRAYLEENRRLVIDFVARELPGVVLHPPEATYLAWLDCRALDLAPDPYRFFLSEAKVALSPGPNFGRPGRGFARINFATSKAILSEALERMAKALRQAGA